MNNPTPENGARVLTNMGVDKSFLDDMYKKYGSYASKIPGLSKGTIGNALSAVERAMGNTRTNPQPVNAMSKKPSGFNSTKYPKV